MARLRIQLLGPFHVTLDGEPVDAFESDSARALLALLAAEPGRARSRAAIAEMLWPERPQGAALGNLRHVLTVLRRALGGSEVAGRFLLADRTRVGLADSPEIWVDLVEFQRAVNIPSDHDGAVMAWTRAVELCREPLLGGVEIDAGEDWDEWLRFVAERIRQQLADALWRLAHHHQRSGDLPVAISFLRRLVEVEPWNERARRQLMRLLARTGETAQAIATFTELQQRLESELGTEPGAETVALASLLRAGDVPADAQMLYPEFLAVPEPAVAPPQFVDREQELTFIDEHLDETLRGHGRLVLISGEAGSGKTMLAAEFARRATGRTDILTARGRCNAFGGLGDPYLPFREALGLLSGDVEASLHAGTIDREQAARLWETLPLAARTIAERGRTLVGTMTGGAALLDRARRAAPAAPWLTDLQASVEAAARRPPAPQSEQVALFDDYACVLEAIAVVHPVLLVVDDLQWADRGSIALLWHLARRLDGHRILMAGLYRPEEVTSSRIDGHPLAPLLNELRLANPNSSLELSGDRGFVDAFIDAEPNELDEAFRSRLFAYTDGNPLYTVELVRGMQERAELRRDQAGVWTAPVGLEWDRLPTRVEAAIGQRIERLPQDLRDDLTAAAVQGEAFIAEAVAEVRSDPATPARLSREGTSPERLVEPDGVTRVDGRLVSRHRFRHVLFQRYLSDQLDEAERMRLHEATGRALETLYEGHPDPPIVDLAYHAERAGLIGPAVSYLLQAGQRASRMWAHEEAMRLLEHAHELVLTFPETGERDAQELTVLVSLAAPVMAVRGYAAPENERIGRRARELCDRIEPAPLVVMALVGMAQGLTIRALHRAAADACSEALVIARELEDDALQVLATTKLGYSLLWAGDLASGQHHLEAAHHLHDPGRDAWLTYAFGVEPGAEALVWDAFTTMIRGQVSEAITLGNAAIALARQLDHPFTLCAVLAVESFNCLNRGEHERGLELVDELESIAEAEHFPYWLAGVDVYRGLGTGLQHDAAEGLVLMRRGLASWRATGVRAHSGYFTGLVAELEHRRGETQRGLEVADEALTEPSLAGEPLSRVCLEVERGRLLRLLGDERAAAALDTALTSARAIGAQLHELRAVAELASLLERAGCPGEARSLVTPVLERFDDEPDVPDLRFARDVAARIGTATSD